jgi:hypothetical protein
MTNPAGGDLQNVQQPLTRYCTCYAKNEVLSLRHCSLLWGACDCCNKSRSSKIYLRNRLLDEDP